MPNIVRVLGEKSQKFLMQILIIFVTLGLKRTFETKSIFLKQTSLKVDIND